MIIVCPCREKKFEVDSNKIPANGRMLKCGSCDQTWFYNPKLIDNSQFKLENEVTESVLIKEDFKIDQNLNKKTDKKIEKKLKVSPSFTLSKILSYLLVIIISFVAAILLLETFKSQLIIFFPGLELILYNLFESIKDIVLFIKDLSL